MNLDNDAADVVARPIRRFLPPGGSRLRPVVAGLLSLDPTLGDEKGGTWHACGWAEDKEAVVLVVTASNLLHVVDDGEATTATAYPRSSVRSVSAVRIMRAGSMGEHFFPEKWEVELGDKTLVIPAGEHPDEVAAAVTALIG